MIVPDVNLLVYAYHLGAPLHSDAKLWWEGLVNGTEQIGIPWVVTNGFVRIMTHPKIHATPMNATDAVDEVAKWFQYPHVFPISPGSQHLKNFRQMLNDAGVGGNLVTDAHIAAVAMEFQAEVHSNDLDFGRFSGLKWVNPI